MKKFITAALVFAFAFLFSGCSSMPSIPRFFGTTVHFGAAGHINNGVLLPVDIIIAPDSVMNAVLEIGPDEWFGHPMRGTLLPEQLSHLAMGGGQTREMDIKVDTDNANRIIIFADYENIAQRHKQQIHITIGTWEYNYYVKIQKDSMELARDEDEMEQIIDNREAAEKIIDEVR